MDEMDKLRAGLKAASPPADPAAKAAALARAMESFDRAQETRAPERPMSDRPDQVRFLNGVRIMLSKLTSRPALAATASVAAICVGVLVAQPALWHAPKVAPAPQPVSAPPVAPTAPAKAEAPLAKVAAPPPAAAPADMPAPATLDATTADGGTTESPPVSALAPEPAPTAPDEAKALAEPAIAPQPASPAASIAENDALAGGALGATSTNDASRSRALAEGEAPPFADMAAPAPDSEVFANADANPVRIVAEAPVSTFSIDVDTASYSVVRSSLNAGSLPPPEAVRIEEMVNYFPYDYAAPKAGEAPFRASLGLFPTPWNKGTEILRIGLQGALPATDDRPALNLVFLIDTSGSMDEPNKLPLLKQSLRLMLDRLSPQDRVAIVTYAGSAGEVLAPTPATDREAILGALDRLGAGGSTAGAEGLDLAYRIAERMQGKGRIGRIILATDGDFNVGISDPGALKDLVAAKRDSGTYLSVLGFGRGNLDDATMQALAQNGNGQAAYIDTLAEAQKVLVDQFTGALFPIANDVKIQIEFNPATVAEYRLIGYETRALKREDFNNDRVDAGEIGAGLQVTALYEVTPVGSAAQLSDPLRYGATPTAPARPASSELGFLKLRYKAPGATGSKLIETPIPATLTEPDADARFATAIAGFGQLLKGGTYLQGWGWADAIALANGARGSDPFGYRTEAVQLMRLGQSLSH